MKEVLIVAIVFGGIVFALAIIPGTILLVIKLFRGGQSAGDQAEEANRITSYNVCYTKLLRNIIPKSVV